MHLARTITHSSFTSQLSVPLPPNSFAQIYIRKSEESTFT